jgi:pimeloyl-ACP methyl ester carboxylesterase
MTLRLSPLLFLHGVGGGHHAWEAQLPYFGGLGYPSHAWDQPGYGHSPVVEPYDLEHVSAALALLIESLGGEPVVLVGHSMGGLIAQETCVRYPQLVKAMALCFTSPAFAGGSSEFTRQFIAARIGPLDQGKTMADIAAKLIPTMGSNSKLAEQIMAGVPPDTYRKAVQLLTTFDRRKELANIKVPTLLIAGSEDKTAPPAMMERMAQKIPGSEYVLIRKCGHLGPMDKPGEFNAALLAFLRKHQL